MSPLLEPCLDHAIGLYGSARFRWNHIITSFNQTMLPNMSVLVVD